MPLLRSLQSWQDAQLTRDNSHGFHLNELHCAERCGHNAVSVGNEMLIWGGYHERVNGFEYCEKTMLWNYYLDHDSWFGVVTSGCVPQYRSGSASSLVWPYWYILGGHTYEGDTNDVYRLNLLTLKWEKLDTGNSAECFSPRDKSSAWSHENRIYCFGGFGIKPFSFLWSREEDKFAYDFETDRGWNDQVLYLDTESFKWVRPSCKGPKPSSRAAHTTVRVGSTVYLFGGRHCSKRMNDLHCFDLSTHTWSGEMHCKGQTPKGRSWHSMSQITEHELLLYGGFSMEENQLDDVWLFNIESLSWSLLKEHTEVPRLWHTSCLLESGDVLVFGGCETNILNNHERMVTSQVAILFRTTPFSLERICLHFIYKNKKVLRDQWSSLPRCHQEWLQHKESAPKEPLSQLNISQVIHGSGPSPSQLSLSKFQAETRIPGARSLFEILFGME